MTTHSAKGASRSPVDSAADELCAVLDDLEIVTKREGDALAVTRRQADRWARQIGRAMLVLHDMTEQQP